MSGYGAEYLAWESEFGAEWCLNDDHPSPCHCNVLERQSVIPSLFATARGMATRRGSIPGAVSAEDAAPVGQAGAWYEDLRDDPRVALSGLLVAQQVARLCRDDGRVVIPWRSLADAVGRKDAAGRTRAFTESGVDVLVGAGWLRVETVGQKRGARTTFYLEAPEVGGSVGVLGLVA
jgi:hypothetical protein